MEHDVQISSIFTWIIANICLWAWLNWNPVQVEEETLPCEYKMNMIYNLDIFGVDLGWSRSWHSDLQETI